MLPWQSCRPLLPSATALVLLYVARRWDAAGRLHVVGRYVMSGRLCEGRRWSDGCTWLVAWPGGCTCDRSALNVAGHPFVAGPLCVAGPHVVAQGERCNACSSHLSILSLISRKFSQE